MCTTYIWLEKLRLGSLHLGYRTQTQADPRSPDHVTPQVLRCNVTGRPASTHGWWSVPVSHPYGARQVLTVYCGGHPALPASPGGLGMADRLIGQAGLSARPKQFGVLQRHGRRCLCLCNTPATSTVGPWSGPQCVERIFCFSALPSCGIHCSPIDDQGAARAAAPYELLAALNRAASQKLALRFPFYSMDAVRWKSQN